MKIARGTIEMKWQLGIDRRPRGGFTLVELLVSVALTVFMLTLFATLFSAGNDAVRIARGSSEADRSVQSAITKLRRDLQFVYVGDNVSLGKAFSAPNQVPTAGYFTIEENMPASPPYYLSDAKEAAKGDAFIKAVQARITLPTPVGYSGEAGPATAYRQGIDERGLPVEVDVDDVLAFTVKLTGNSPENIFYGKVPIGSLLDNDLDPGSRFDQPDNGIFTSPFAEVVYFLRPSRSNSLVEVNRPALGSDDGRITSPVTYTLYRRELLLVSPQQRDTIEKKLVGISSTASIAVGDMTRIQGSAYYLGLNPSLDSARTTDFNPSFYHNYDVSVYFGFDPNKTGGVNSAANYSLRLNDPNTIRVRQNRYGMQWLVFPATASSGLPWNPSIPSLLFPDFAVPGYDHPTIASGAARMYVPGSDIQWRGRPTLYESTMIGSEGINDANYNPTTGGGIYASLDLNNAATFPNYYQASTNSRRRNDADVLMTNVISFDVKVLNDDVAQGVGAGIQGQYVPGSKTPIPDLAPNSQGIWVPSIPADPKNWPASRTSALPLLSTYDVYPKSDGTNSNNRPGVVAGNTSRPWVDPLLGTSPSVYLSQEDFVDVGFNLLSEIQLLSSTALLVFQSGNADPTVASTWHPRCVLDRSFISDPSFPVLPTYSVPYAVTWGTQTPSRWCSAGRIEANAANYNSVLSTSYQPLRSVYDTWAPEYKPEYFANNFCPISSPAPNVKNGFLPPYDRPVRGVQISIRILEPKTGLIREFQVVHRFN